MSQVIPSDPGKNSLPGNSSSDVGEDWRLFWVFLAWCFQRESLRLWNYLIILAPVLMSGFVVRGRLSRAFPTQGSELLESLLFIAAIFIFLEGVIHASKAVCWEVSREFRDLVRLTGIDSSTLLWCRSLSRWWTIALSIVVILPLAVYGRTMGGITGDQLFAGGCWLLLATVLTAGFAMVASVSSNRAANAETTAATGSFLLMLVYHMFFWLLSVFIGLVVPYLYSQFGLAAESRVHQSATLALSFAPMNGFYRSLKSPATFSLLDPVFWLHFITAFLCMWAAKVVIRNRLRVSTQGDDPLAEPGIAPRKVLNRGSSRPRCSDTPFFWKDTYILGAGRWSQVWWTFLSGIGLFALIGSTIRNDNTAEVLPLVFGIIAICLLPCVIAVRFDALITAEFRDNTWNSLMLLPIDPRIPIIAKIQAAAWERKAIFVPVLVGAAMASYWNVIAVMIAATIALLVGILMVEVSILNQFYSKSWWVGPFTGLFIVLMIGVIILFWAFYGVASGFVFTILSLGILDFCIYAIINWKLNHWTES
jgi:hypothetical protein